MEERRESECPERLTNVIGSAVVDSAGVSLGVVVGRIISGTTIDLLVRRRRLFHRSRYMRLQGAAITSNDRVLVYHPTVVAATVKLEIVRASTAEACHRKEPA